MSRCRALGAALAALLLAFSLPGVRCEPSNCNDDTLLKCISIKIEGFNFATMKEELNTVCPDLLAGLRCVDNYTKNCLDPEKRSHFNMLYSETSMTTQAICQEGPYQEEFLRHAPCMLVMKNGDCSWSYDQNMRDTGEDRDAKLCCSMRNYLRCSIELVQKNCGNETAKFTAGYLDRLTNAVQTHCRSDSGDLRKCSEYKGRGGGSAGPTPILLATLALLAALSSL